MPTLSITTRRRRNGDRYVVRYRTGGRDTPLVHAGSFKTRQEAETRRAVIAQALAAGHDPKDTLFPQKRETRPQTVYIHIGDFVVNL